MGDFNVFTISHYQVYERLQSDRTFAIYHARDLQAQDAEDRQPETCLFWVVFPGRDVSEGFASYFLERLHLLSLFEHPNLLPILEFGREQGMLYWVTPQVEGRLLSTLLKEPRKEKEAARIASEVFAGLMELHQQNLVHGYLSPDSIILTKAGQVYLFNYGMAALINAEILQMAPERMVGIGIGNPAYMAPEQIMGHEISPASDIYAAGAVYFALLSGVDPHQGATLAETVIQQAAQPPRWPARLPTRVSSSSIRFIHKCLSRKPAERYQHASDALQVLNRLALGKPARVRVSKAQMAGAPRPSYRVLNVVLALLILLLAGWLVDLQFGSQLARMLFPGAPTLPTAVAPKTVVIPSTEQAPSATATITRTPAPPMAEPSATLTPTITLTPTLAPPGPAVDNTTLTPTPDVLPEALISGQTMLVGMPIPGAPEQITAQNLGQLRETIRLGFGRFNQVGWSPDAQRIAVATSAGVFILHPGMPTLFIDPGDEAGAAQFTRDGETLVVGLQNGDVQLWNWRTLQKTATFSGHTKRVSRILFPSDTRRLITASHDQHIRIWDINSGRTITTIPAHPYPINDIDITPDGRYLASCSKDQMIKIWDVATGSKYWEFRYDANVRAVAFSSDGRLLAAGGENGKITQWDIITKQLRVGVDPIAAKRSIWNLYYQPGNDNSLIAGLDDGSTQKINAIQRSSWQNNSAYVKIEAPGSLYDKLGNSFVFSTHLALSRTGNEAMIKWDGTLKAAGNFTFDIQTRFEDFNRLVFSPDGRYLLAGGSLSNLYLWDVVDNRLAGVDSGDIAPGYPFSSDGQSLILYSRIYDKETRLRTQVTFHDFPTLFSGRTLARGARLSEMPVNSGLQFSKADTLIVAGTDTKSLFWDTHSKMNTFLVGANDSGCQVTKSKNTGHIIAIHSPFGLMNPFDLTSTQLDPVTKRLCNYSTRFRTRLALASPDRTLIVSMNDSKQFELLNLTTDQVVWRVPVQHAIATIAFSPDQSMLVTGSADGSLTLWDVQTGAVLQAFRAHFGPVRAVIFSPNGLHLASGGGDGTVRIWEVRDGGVQ